MILPQCVFKYNPKSTSSVSSILNSMPTLPWCSNSWQSCGQKNSCWCTGEVIKMYLSSRPFKILKLYHAICSLGIWTFYNKNWSKDNLSFIDTRMFLDMSLICIKGCHLFSSTCSISLFCLNVMVYNPISPLRLLYRKINNPGQVKTVSLFPSVKACCGQ